MILIFTTNFLRKSKKNVENVRHYGIAYPYDNYLILKAGIRSSESKIIV